MPALAREQENTKSILNWFTTVNGVLTDTYEMGYQIWDIIGGLPGTVVFPVPGDDSQWEDVTSDPGNFSPGSYYAYDNTAGAGYTPGIAQPVGTHRIKWRWKISAAAPYQQDAEDFEVLVQSAGSSADNYISVDDVRKAGISESNVSDDDVLVAINMWQQFIDRACRQWFVPKSLTIKMNGNDSDTLFMGIPIIDVTYLKINGSEDASDASLYKVFNSNTYPDDRGNPRIKLVNRNERGRNIFTTSLSYIPRFRRGYQNQEIQGIFGYVEPDGSVPAMIQRAHLKLVVEKLTRPVYPTGVGSSLIQSSPEGQTIIREKTDGHEIEYANTIKNKGYSYSGITNDPEILEIIAMYRAPIGLATPADWSRDDK